MFLILVRSNNLFFNFNSFLFCNLLYRFFQKSKIKILFIVITIFPYCNYFSLIIIVLNVTNIYRDHVLSWF